MRLPAAPGALRALVASAVLAASLALAIGVAPPPAAAAGVQWYDGSNQHSTVVNCPAMIGGYPYEEPGVVAYAGFLADPDSGLPTPGQTFYAHIVMGGAGFPCNGSRVGVEFRLPAGLDTAVTGATPVKCFYNGSPLPAAECPQTLPAGSASGYRQVRSPNASPYLWPVAQGKTFEFQIPLKATTTLTNAPFDTRLIVVDGYQNPVLTPGIGIYVFPPGTGGGGSSTPEITYPSPSTTGITPSAAKSTAYLFTKGLGGNAWFDLGTTPGAYNLFTDGPAVVPAGDVGGFEVWSDWTPYALQPGTTYYWRMRFVASNGTTTFGPQQSFTTGSNGSATVGTGTPASCTPAALNAAYSATWNSGTGSVRFDCGPNPVTIEQSAMWAFPKSMTIDGRGLVSLRPQGGGRLFRFTGGTTTLRGLGMTGADNGACGAAFTVEAGATVTLESSRVTGNRSTTQGGGACVLAGGSLTVWKSAISGNTSTGPGGGVANFGSLSLSSSEISGNTAAGDGGGIYSAANPAITDLRYSTIAGNKAGADGVTSTRGGGIQALGLVEAFTSTISGNTAGRGGGLAATTNGEYFLNSVTVAANTARLAGGAGAIDASSTNNTSLRNTLVSGNGARNCSADAAARKLISQGTDLDSGTTCGFTATGDRSAAGAELGPLAYNGGLTRTHALLVGSAAIDGGGDLYCGFSDQRGVGTPNSDRLIDGDLDGVAHCDIGAFERQPDGTSGPARSVSATGGSLQATVSWQAPIDNGGHAVTGYVVTPYKSNVAQPPRTFSSTATTQVVTGLTAGSYTFRVAAKNSVGAGAPSLPSGATTVTAPAGPAGSVYVPISPCRVVDTRSGGGAFTTGQQRSYQVGGSGSGFAAQGGTAGGCGIPDGAKAVEASVTAVNPTGSGFLRAWPADQTAPNATFLNFTGRQSTTNTGSISLAPAGTQDLALKNFSPGAHYVIDVQGFFVPRASAPPGSVYVPISPCRVVDTRSGGGAFTTGQQRSYQVGGSGSGFAAQGGTAGGCGIPDGAKAVEASVTAVNPTGSGFLRAWPADQAAPNATFLNFTARQSTTNTGSISLAPTGTQDLALKNYSPGAHYVIDVQGYFVPEGTVAGGAVYVPTSPCRVVDTRSGGGALASSQQRSFQVGGSGSGFATQGGTAGGCGVPDGAAAVEASVTAVSPGSGGFLRAWPADQTAPNATFLNFTATRSTTNTGSISLAPTDTQDLAIKNYAARTHYVMDLQGYWVR